MQLNVVEYRPELEWLPLPVASPACGKSKDEPITEEAFDFENMYYQDGKVRKILNVPINCNQFIFVIFFPESQLVDKYFNQIKITEMLFSN